MSKQPTFGGSSGKDELNRALAEAFESEPGWSGPRSFPICQSKCWIGAFNVDGVLIRKDPRDFTRDASLLKLMLEWLLSEHYRVVLGDDAGMPTIDIHTRVIGGGGVFRTADKDLQTAFAIATAKARGVWRES